MQARDIRAPEGPLSNHDPPSLQRLPSQKLNEKSPTNDVHDSLETQWKQDIQKEVKVENSFIPFERITFDFYKR